MNPFTILPTSAGDIPWMREFIRTHWGDEIIVVNQIVYRPHEHPGFYARLDDQLAGLITYRILGSGCEILTLNSLLPGKGIGSALVNQVSETAIQAGCRRLDVTTTNDNYAAIRFYENHGFFMTAVRWGAVDETRLLKPSIPLVGENGIPIQDEIVLEKILL